MAEREIEAGEERLIRVIDKGLGGQVRIRLSRFRERDYVDIRNFYEAEEGEWRPTRKGIAIPVEMFDDLMDALTAAREEIGGAADRPEEA